MRSSPPSSARPPRARAPQSAGSSRARDHRSVLVSSNPFADVGPPRGRWSLIVTALTRMDGLIAAVGEERFRDAQEWAWATAAGTGRSLRSGGDDKWPAGIVDVPHDLSDLIWDKSEEPWLAQLELAFGAVPPDAVLRDADVHAAQGMGRRG